MRITKPKQRVYARYADHDVELLEKCGDSVLCLFDDGSKIPIRVVSLSPKCAVAKAFLRIRRAKTPTQ